MITEELRIEAALQDVSKAPMHMAAIPQTQERGFLSHDKVLHFCRHTVASDVRIHHNPRQIPQGVNGGPLMAQSS